MLLLVAGCQMHDGTEDVGKEFISTTRLNPDKTVSSTIYTVEKRRMLEIDYNPDGTPGVVYRDPQAPFGFWSEWDDCLGTVGAPFNSNFANIAFETVATASTLGLWIPALFLVCGGIAAGRA